MTEDNADRQQAAGWPGQPFPGPPASPYPSGPPARPSSAPTPYRPPTSPTFTYSPPTAGQVARDQGPFPAGPGPQPPPGPPPSMPPGPPSVPPTAPLPGGPTSRPAPAPAPPPSFGGPAASPAPRPAESPFSAPPRQSTVPGQAAASEVHQTIRLPHPEPGPRPGPDAPAPWAAGPLPQPDSTFGADPYAPPTAKSGPGVGTRVLGVVAGLPLGLLGFVGILVGPSSLQGNQTRGLWFGIGLVLLTAAVLLGSWTAATPITAGAVGALPGLFGVIAPDTWGDIVGRLTTIDLDLAGVSANGAIAALGSYPAAAAGVLLVAAGVTTVLGRRRGAAAARQT